MASDISNNSMMVLYQEPIFSAKLTDKLSFYDCSMNALIVSLRNLVIEIKGIENIYWL